MNADDICAELAAARQDLAVALRALNATKYDDVVERIDLAIAGIDQAVRVWSAERDYWADVERQAVLAEREPVARESLQGLARDIATIMGAPQPTRPDPGLSEAWLTGKSDVRNPSEQPVVWAKRHESIHGFEDDWRSHGIA